MVSNFVRKQPTMPLVNSVQGQYHSKTTTTMQKLNLKIIWFMRFSINMSQKMAQRQCQYLCRLLLCNICLEVVVIYRQYSLQFPLLLLLLLLTSQEQSVSLNLRDQVHFLFQLKRNLLSSHQRQSICSTKNRLKQILSNNRRQRNKIMRWQQRNVW